MWNEDDVVCHECLSDEGLRDYVRKSGKVSRCHRCGRRRRCITVGHIADLVDEVYRLFYTGGRYTPEGQTGSYPDDIIRHMMFDDDTGLPEAIAGILSDREAYAVARNGDDPFYESSSCYEWADGATYPWELSEEWHHFETRIKYERRFLDPAAHAFLERLSEVIEAVGPGVAHVRVLQPGEKVFRARGADTLAGVKTIMEAPAAELGPPPRHLRTAGRLNAQGIATFYGAFEAKTCIAEVRPNVGGYAVYAAFEAMKPLRLLDLRSFDGPHRPGSVFSSGYIERSQYLKFLRSFHALVSRPVVPGEAALAYVPTQVVAEYLAYSGFDGVIYRSAQAGDLHDPNRQGLVNVALFDAEGIVEYVEDVDEQEVPTKQGDVHPPRLIIPGEYPDQRPEPSLRYVPNSIKLVRIRTVDVNYEDEYLMDDYTIGGRDIVSDYIDFV